MVFNEIENIPVNICLKKYGFTSPLCYSGNASVMLLQCFSRGVNTFLTECRGRRLFRGDTSVDERKNAKADDSV